MKNTSSPQSISPSPQPISPSPQSISPSPQSISPSTITPLPTCQSSSLLHSSSSSSNSFSSFKINPPPPSCPTLPSSSTSPSSILVPPPKTQVLPPPPSTNSSVHSSNNNNPKSNNVSIQKELNYKPPSVNSLSQHSNSVISPSNSIQNYYVPQNQGVQSNCFPNSQYYSNNQNINSQRLQYPQAYYSPSNLVGAAVQNTSNVSSFSQVHPTNGNMNNVKDVHTSLRITPPPGERFSTVFLSNSLFSHFINAASKNTANDLEFIGILCGKVIFYLIYFY
jgi:hypothetical protein